MSQIWFIGKPDKRTISAADFVAAGVTGGQATVTWDSTNNWSVNQNTLTASAITFLSSLPDFQAVGTDTFPVRATYGSPPATPQTARYVPVRKVAGATTASPGEMVAAGGTGGYSVACAQAGNGQVFCVFNNGSGTVTVTVPSGATLKGLADNSGATVTTGVNGTVALTANGQVQLLTDGTDYWII